MNVLQNHQHILYNNKLLYLTITSISIGEITLLFARLLFNVYPPLPLKPNTQIPFDVKITYLWAAETDVDRCFNNCRHRLTWVRYFVQLFSRYAMMKLLHLQIWKNVCKQREIWAGFNTHTRTLSCHLNIFLCKFGINIIFCFIYRALGNHKCRGKRFKLTKK